MTAPDRVLIFDATLRDGEQTAGAGLTMDEKVRIAQQLARMRVDIVEAGFPASSPGDARSVERIAREVKGPTIAALSRALPGDIDAAWGAIKDADKPRIHTFLSASEIHLMHQMRRDRETIMTMAVDAVKRAKSYCSDVEFSPMDATRSEPDYLYAMLEATIEAGATTINIPDTVGYTTPVEFAELIKGIFNNVRNLDSVTVSVHCHNDLGLAVANTLAAIEAGARQVEGCINGLGERAGNAATEEIIMALETRFDHYGVKSEARTEEIGPTSRLVSNIFGFPVQMNKAIVGGNAFRHSSGIHQDGFLKERTTFEIMEPKSVGWRGEAVILSKLSGRAGLRARLNELGYTLNDQELNNVFVAFKELGDQKSEVTDRDLEALMSEQQRRSDVERAYRLEKVKVVCGDEETPTATITLGCPDGTSRTETAEGTGPVDAVCKAVDRILEMPINLTEFSVSSVTEGIDALGEVTMRVEADDGRVYAGRGSSTDIIVASATAYVNAINRMLAMARTG